MNSLLVIGMIAALGLIIPSYAQAVEPTTISVVPFGDSTIDLADAEWKRTMFVWVSFENFSLDDGTYSVQIVSPDSETVIAQYDIVVKSTKTGFANFSSLVLFALTNSVMNTNEVVPGQYEMLVVTQNGVSESIPVNIIDSNNS